MKKIKNLVYFAISVFFLISCNDETVTHSGPSVLTGTIVGAENQKLFIRQEVLNNNFLDTINVMMNGEFSFDIMLDKPSYFTLFVGRNQVILYMKPGDSLMLNADIQMFDDIKFSNSSAIYNDYLAKFAQTQGSFADKMQSLFMRDEASALKSIDSLRSAQMDGLYEMEKNFSKMDKVFLSTEKERIKYFWGLNHIMYPLYYNYFNQTENFKPSANFDSYLGELNINDSNLLALPEYRQFISNYLNSKVNDYFTNPEIMQANPSFTKYQLDMIKTVFDDANVRSYLSYKIIKDHVTYDGIKDYDIIYPSFVELCKNELFKEEIDNDLSAWNALKKGMPSVDFGGVDIKGDSVHLSDFKGKYVYVDVWATWCNPCLGEIPSMLDLQKKLAGKNIVILGCSVDRDKDKWDEMVKNRELAGKQIYVGFNENLSGFYKISGIPRFMLFDKEGNILEVSADRPSAMGIDTKLLSLDGI